jgi:hypothetical protein
VSEPIDPKRLPLVAVERFFVRAQASGGSPVFSAEADFDGVLDSEVLRQAIDAVLPHHPLLRSQVETLNGCMYWQEVETPFQLEHEIVKSLERPFPGCSFLDTPSPIPIDLRPGLNVRLTTSGNGRSNLRFEYHHACTDGQGGARFYRDVTLAYATMKLGGGKCRVGDKNALVTRGHFSPPAGEPSIGIRESLRNLWVTIRGSNHRIEPVVCPGTANDFTAPQNELVAQFILHPQQARTIHEYLLRSKHVMNDVMMSATFMMLKRCSISKPTRSYFNILNPVDMRAWSDRRLPAANRVGFAFIRRRPIDWSGPEDLLESVANQLRYVRKRGVAAELMKGIEMIENVPLALNRVERSGRFTPTATLTCLSNLQLGRRHGVTLEGDRWMLAGAKVDRVACIAPLPTAVPLAITVTDANGNIAITIRGARCHFDESRLKAFGESFCQSCDEICQYQSRTRKAHGY